MNQRDSEIMGGLLEAAGYEKGTSLDEAELVVFNTCSVRHSAENKVFGKLGEVLKYKAQNPRLRVAFGGCMAQLPEIRKRLKKMGVDLVFGTHNLHQLPLLLEEVRAKNTPLYSVWERPKEVVEGLPSLRTSGLTAFVNIMYGCNNYCSYCIVPYTRGHERSREPDYIIKEIRELVAKGTREVTLLGQNVNSYGRGLEARVDFADLLDMVNDIDGLYRIRFTTSHPRDVSDKLIEAVAGLDRVCEHIHVPLQAGSNKVLKLMNRGYTREDYFSLVDKMRERISGVAITSDLIVGFPGEEEGDFAATLEAVERIRFDAAFTFMYSPRTGTRACEMEGQVPKEVKNRRLLQLNEVQYRIALKENQRLEQKIVEVLVEGPSKTNPERLSGRTRTNRIVVFEGDSRLVGQLVWVKITEARTFSLRGQWQGNEV